MPHLIPRVTVIPDPPEVQARRAELWTRVRRPAGLAMGVLGGVQVGMLSASSGLRTATWIAQFVVALTLLATAAMLILTPSLNPTTRSKGD